MLLPQIKIFSTKTLAKPLLKRAQWQHIHIDAANFIETRPINTPSVIEQVKSYAGQQTTVLFTSANAVETVFTQVKHTPHWKIFCLSGKTKMALMKHFREEDIIAAAPNASVLAQKIIANDAIKSCVFFCGNKRMFTLPDTFLFNGIALDEVVVYETIRSPKEITKTYDGILFFSPSAVESFFSINKTNAQTVFFSIGKTTEKAIRKFTNNPIITPRSPSVGNVLREVENYFISK